MKKFLMSMMVLFGVFFNVSCFISDKANAMDITITYDSIGNYYVSLSKEELTRHLETQGIIYEIIWRVVGINNPAPFLSKVCQEAGITDEDRPHGLYRQAAYNANVERTTLQKSGIDKIVPVLKKYGVFCSICSMYYL